MEEGLAQNMVYGSGANNIIKHSYAGTIKNKRRKRIKLMSKNHLTSPKKCKK